MTSMDVRPPIPQQLAHRPTLGGLVVPWDAPELADGGYDFRGTHTRKAVQCWTEGRCGMCGEQFGPPPFVFLTTDIDIYVSAPPMHPVCAAYVMKACPIVSGRQSHFSDRPPLAAGHRGEKCFEPGCDCGGWVQEDVGDQGGQPNKQWFAIWAYSWSIAVNDAQQVLGGVPTNVRKVRPVPTPDGCPI
jgi:hypothetical protein